jgi:transcriptional regulator with XRE-family HTH domain
MASRLCRCRINVEFPASIHVQRLQTILHVGFLDTWRLQRGAASPVLVDRLTSGVHYNFGAPPKQLGEHLKNIRESLGLTELTVSGYIRVAATTLESWEFGRRSPTGAEMYRWCHALGLVCPPKTALVRVVDFSPELLQFLREDPTRLRTLSPDQFERFVAERLDRMGYNVTLTGATNRKDGGIDLIAAPKTASVGSVVIAGQMKHHRDRKTEREAVDRLLSWKDSYFGVGLLVTNTAFTKDAVWTAQQERNHRFLRLRDFTDLKRWLEGHFGSAEDWREIPNRIELAPGVVIEIPKPRIITPLDLKLGRSDKL